MLQISSNQTSKTRERFLGTNALVIGLGISGQSAARFLLKRGASVTGVDSNEKLASENEKVSELCQQGMTFVHEGSALKMDLNHYNLVVVSPGIPCSHPLYAGALQSGIEVIGEIELACREIKAKCAAVTGTNGKTTVTLLTAHILRNAGIRAAALGNIGVPLTSAIDDGVNEAVDVFVVELSSFQLETLTSRFIDAAVLLNISPDHLDRYSSMDDYAAVKIGIEKNLKENGRLFVEYKCLKEYAHLFAKEDYPSYGYHPHNYLYTDTQDIYLKGKKILSVSDLSPCGKKGLHHDKSGFHSSHEIENIMASFALCRAFSITPEEFLQGFASFQKPSHRIEFVRTIEGVNYYDDSKGTNIDAVIRAVEMLDGQIVLIAGGVDKGFPYTPWINAFKGKVKAICAIGQSKEKMKSDLGNFIPVSLFPCLDQAVAFAAGIAQTGENVLLSPGCSSFDMFKDYVHRGLEFQRIIKGL